MPVLPAKHVLIFSERPPPVPDAPVTGLSLRHALMAEAFAASGLEVTYAWPGTDRARRDASRCRPPFATARPNTPDDLAAWIDRFDPCAVVLGYWELADWIPARLPAPLVLDYVAPRVLERQFEDRDRLVEEIPALIEVLVRCDEVWVGNAAQRDLMLPWMLLAGHDCRFDLPVRVVPIAGTIAARRPDPGPASDSEDEPLKLFHGGRDWPWRDSSAWLDIVRRQPGPWRLDDAGEAGGLAGHAGYLQRLGRADLVLELSEANLERRYSQSFRMTDALCAGVPVVCNDFLPLAERIERHRAGWVVEKPEDLPVLLHSIAADRAELARRAHNALALARAHFDAARVYGGLAGDLAARADGRTKTRRQPLLALRSGDAELPGTLSAFRAYLVRWANRRVRKPCRDWLARKMADRPLPDAATGNGCGSSRACWVVLGRADVFPTNHGAAVKIERTAWGLSFHVGEVILLTDRRDGYWVYRRGEREYRRFPVWLRLAGWPRPVDRIRLMARGVPYSEVALYLPWVDRGMQLRLVWLMRRHRVWVVHGEFPAYARPAVWAAQLFGTRSLMVEHNVEFRRIADQVPELGDAAGRALKRFEVDLANACDRVITVSERDRRDLIAAGVRGTRVHTVPHGVDLERFAQAGPVALRERYAIPAAHAVLVYHGIYSYPPNLQALEELAGVLLPKLEAAGRPATVVAIGPEPPAVSLPGVVFTGAVDDLAGYLKGGDLAVIPLRQGGGTRMKILDDFAAGVPVVTTAAGMQGIPVEHGRELLIVDDPDAMADAVAGLLDDARAQRRLADAAARWVAASDWREIARRYVALIDTDAVPAAAAGVVESRP